MSLDFTCIHCPRETIHRETFRVQSLKKKLTVFKFNWQFFLDLDLRQLKIQCLGYKIKLLEVDRDKLLKSINWQKQKIKISLDIIILHL